MKPQTKFDRLQKLMRRWELGAVAFKECGLLSLASAPASSAAWA
jgi:hypothetical protein